jgi:bis(5'-nucleosyl)-tetraphosphatase (symmetrical)
MTRYAVGDIQGCLQPLQCLLQDVNFNPQQDQLWFVGDLINRGPESLATLRFIRQLGDCTRIVLGNHDLHFLAVAFGAIPAGKSDTFDEILAAEDRDSLIHWLLQQPLLYSDPGGDYHMVHAGIPPIWNIQQAATYANEVETVLRSNDAASFFQSMYGNQPNCWQQDLEGWARLRLITNYFTRLRFCKADGTLEFKHKQPRIDEPGFEDYAPWFSYPRHRNQHEKILFGHWASLQGQCDADNIFALDTGCVWGNSLTLMNLDRQTFSSCHCTTTIDTVSN